MSQLSMNSSHKLLYNATSKKLVMCGGGGTLYRQARQCTGDTLADAWMTTTDAATFTGSFFIVGVGCLHFDFGDTPSALGGTLYTAGDATAYANCPACFAAYCISGAYDYSSPATVTSQLPTTLTFGTCATPTACSPTISSPVTLTEDGAWRYEPGYPPYPTLCIAGWLAGDPGLNTAAVQVSVDTSGAFNDPGDPCVYQYLEFLFQTGTTQFDIIIVLYRRKVLSDPQPITGYYEYFRTVAYPWDNSAICVGATALPNVLRVY